MAKKITYSDLVQGQAVNYKKIGKVSAESVEKHTGKDWKTWIPILEKSGAQNWTYQEIAVFLKKKYKLTIWWQHEVTRGFEIAVGRRNVGQDAKGKYMVTATKSIALETTVVWKRLLSKEGLEVWLHPLSHLRILPKTSFETKDGFFGEIRTVAKGRKIRMSWQDPLWDKPTTVEVLLVPRPKKKSILVINHTGIHNEKAREMLRTRWRTDTDEFCNKTCGKK